MGVPQFPIRHIVDDEKLEEFLGRTYPECVVTHIHMYRWSYSNGTCEVYQWLVITGPAPRFL